MDSSSVSDVHTGITLLITAISSVTALVGYVVGKFVKFKKKKSN